MALRFIIGRAGTGKTHYCLEAIRRRLAADSLDGPRLIFLVPEQASQQMERAILLPRGAGTAQGPIAAAHRAEVFSFQRLADRVLESTAAPLRTTLSEAARVMVLRHLVARLAPRMEYYRRVGGLSGFFERLSATIGELIQEGVSPADLAVPGDGTKASSAAARGADPARSAKMHDLALIYAAYLECLGPDRLDPSQHLELARECLPRCAWLRGAELWVDGFASLSGQEAMTLTALARLCAHVEIAVLLDPAQAAGAPARTASGRLFSRTLRTYQELRRMLQEAGIAEGEPLVLSAQNAPRFARTKVLADLERGLFSNGGKPGERMGIAGDGRGVVVGGRGFAGVISLVELPSPRVEAEYAVSRICAWTRSNPPTYRYRDIAIIARNLDRYHDLVAEALDSRGIPYFIDRRRPIAHHPLVELLRCGVLLVAESMSLESVRLLLKTGLTPLSDEQCDELENYVLAHGISGEESWLGSDWSFRRLATLDQTEKKQSSYERASIARINEARRLIVDCLSEWLQFAKDPAGHRGSEWADGIRAWLVRMEVANSLRRWAENAEESGDLNGAEEHRQVWSDVSEFLGDLAAAFGELKLTIAELGEVLGGGLEWLTLGLVPPTVDQVLVGSVERSRHPEIKAAIVLGFNEGVFPAPAVEDTILNDDDREALGEAKVRIGLPARRRVADELMLAYIALTRASDELLVTYARADDDGGALRPSQFVGALRAALPGLDVTHVADPTRDRSMWEVQTMSDVRRRLAMEFRSRRPREGDIGEDRARWNELYTLVRLELGDDAVTRAGLSSLGDRKEEALSGATVERLFAGKMRTSVSQLESYAACPFKYFSEHVLRLRPRAEAAIAAVDVGKVHHAILEDFAKSLMSRRGGLGRSTEGELLEGLRESCARVAGRLPPSGELSDARNAHLLRRSAGRLARVLQAQRRANQADRMRPAAAELAFGMDDREGLPALTLSTPNGRSVVLRGVIDRLDVAEAADEVLGVVVDYKDTRDKRLDMARVYHGLSLQLLAYLLVLAEKGETPGGAGRSAPSDPLGRYTSASRLNITRWSIRRGRTRGLHSKREPSRHADCCARIGSANLESRRRLEIGRRITPCIGRRTVHSGIWNEAMLRRGRRSRRRCGVRAGDLGSLPTACSTGPLVCGRIAWAALSHARGARWRRSADLRWAFAKCGSWRRSNDRRSSYDLELKEVGGESHCRIVFKDLRRFLRSLGERFGAGFAAWFGEQVVRVETTLDRARRSYIVPVSRPPPYNRRPWIQNIMAVYPFKLDPIFKPRIWGGRRLESRLRKRLPLGQSIGESWEVANLENDDSIVAVGAEKGKTLGRLLRLWGTDLVGRAKLIDGRFPLLIKFLDAAQALSIQVHPSPAAASRLGGHVRIKNEAWYVIDAQPQAWILRGLCAGVEEATLREAIGAGRVESVLNRLPARPGHAYYLPSGTIHALGPGVLVAEVQTPSDVTYRLHDWDRVDPTTGQQRELQVDEALASLRYDAPPAEAEHPQHVASVWTSITSLVRSESFVIERVRMVEGVELPITYEELVIWIVLEGRGSVAWKGMSDPLVFGVGDTVVLPAALKDGRVEVHERSMWLEVSLRIESSLAGFDRPERLTLREPPAPRFVPLSVKFPNPF